jgi:hypothetical protein
LYKAPVRDLMVLLKSSQPHGHKFTSEELTLFVKRIARKNIQRVHTNVGVTARNAARYRITWLPVTIVLLILLM